MSEPLRVHRRELSKLALFLLLLSGCIGVSYALPQGEAVRPWIRGEPLPLLHLFFPDHKVVENQEGELVRVAEALPTPVPTDPAIANLPQRSPALRTPLEFPEGSLDAFFESLAHTEDGEPEHLTRVLHWGDSTIAGDGIIGSVRARLQDHFGDGGPGFLAVHVDPLWSMRPGIARWLKGDWQSLITTFGGAETPRYGLAATVSTAHATEEEPATATLGGLKIGDERQLLYRFDVFYQVQPEGGTLVMVPRGTRGRVAKTASETIGDRFRSFEVEKGAPWIWIEAKPDGPVTLYGVALETRQGITWENLGVMGASIGTLFRQGRNHLATQVKRRNPDLVVFQTGGNELSYPGLKKGEGEDYAKAFGRALDRIRKGAPEASCMVIGPLDQATRSRGQVVSKPMLARMTTLQRQVALERGCAFWDTRHVMGGEDGFRRWLEHEPRFALSDLMHLTSGGLDLVGQSLADAIEDSYKQWRALHPESGWTPPFEEPLDPGPSPPAAQGDTP